MIGILAGMGPMSTGPFVDLLMKQWQIHFNAVNDIDFPHTLIYSLPTPFYINKETNKAQMYNSLRQSLNKLQDSGADFIAMPCNTLHEYYRELQSSINIPLLNIITATVGNIECQYKNVTILSTEHTLNSKLYQNQLEKVNKNFIFINSWQCNINNLIHAIKSNQDKQDIYNITTKIIQQLNVYGIQLIIIACTDINMAVKKILSKHYVIIDSAHCLVEDIIKNYKRLR